MKDKYLFIIVMVCVLCTFGAQNTRAQKMYMDNGKLILDCGEGSGFPQSIVEKESKQKSIETDENLIDGTQNKKVYHKLEIEQSDNTAAIWATAYNTCQNKNTGGVTGWRLPTQREMQLISIFGPAINALTNNGLTTQYWVLTELKAENQYTAAWYVRSSGYSAATLKSNNSYSYRCVREIPVAANL